MFYFVFVCHDGHFVIYQQKMDWNVFKMWFILIEMWHFPSKIALKLNFTLNMMLLLISFYWYCFKALQWFLAFIIRNLSWMWFNVTIPLGLTTENIIIWICLMQLSWFILWHKYLTRLWLYLVFTINAICHAIKITIHITKLLSTSLQIP